MSQFRAFSILVLMPIRSLFDELLLYSGFANDNIEIYQWTPHGRFRLDETAPESLFHLNSGSMTRILVHGWHENSSIPAYEQLAKNYYSLDSFANILLVDYGELAKAGYIEAPAIVRRAGPMLGYKILTLINLGFLSVKRIHVFSHSLGTHVSGMAARVIKQELNQTIARISASDPAGPLFRAPFGIGPLSNSLTRDDADLLDITHTSYIAGTREAFGTVDTYVDLLAGRQPACVGQDSSTDELLFCDHRLARTYFTESVLSCGFHQTLRADHTDEAFTYGEHMALGLSGVFTMRVNARPPYAQDINTFPDCLRRN